MAETNKTLFQRISAASKAIGHIEKKAAPGAGVKYKYQQWDEVVPLVRDAMAANDLWVTVEAFDAVCNERKTRDGGTAWAWTVSVRATVHASTPVPSGPESITLSWVGEAADTGDKGVQKAFTSAVKYGLLKLFYIPTYEEESDASDMRLSAPAASASDGYTPDQRAKATDWIRNTIGPDVGDQEMYRKACLDSGVNPIGAALQLIGNVEGPVPVDELVKTVYERFKSKGGGK